MNKRLMLGFYKDEDGEFTYKNHFADRGKDSFTANDIISLMGISARFIKDVLLIMKDPLFPQHEAKGILKAIVNGLLSVYDEEVSE